MTILDTAGAPAPSSKGGGPEICYGPDDDGGAAGPPQVAPGVFDKTAFPPAPEIEVIPEGQAAALLRQDPYVEPPFRLADTVLWEPALTAWDEGFA